MPCLLCSSSGECDSGQEAAIVIEFDPKNPNFERHVRSTFECQKIMATIGAVLTRVEPGDVEIELPFRAAST